MCRYRHLFSFASPISVAQIHSHAPSLRILGHVPVRTQPKHQHTHTHIRIHAHAKPILKDLGVITLTNSNVETHESEGVLPLLCIFKLALELGIFSDQALLVD